LVEVFWGSITCNDDDEIVVPEAFKQPLQDHGIGYIQHLKFINAEDVFFGTELISNNSYGIALLPFGFLVYLVLFLMDLKHELLVVEELLVFDS
jgi:hypothetical protein